MKTCRLLVAGALLSLAGCAAGPTVPPAASSEPRRQFMCVSRVHLSEATQAYQLSAGNDVAPLGSWLDEQIAQRFWVDAARKASGQPQPVVTTGFATGTGVRPAGIGKVDAQVVLQFQLMKPTGQSYFDGVGGRATAHSVQQASREALDQALRGLEDVLTSTGFCRQME